MADQGGISRVLAHTVQAPTGQPASRSTALTPTAGQGVGRREVPDQNRRQWVNIDGKTFDRAARRGTYLNILV